MTKTAEESTIDRIMAMSDTEFRSLAEDDVREATGKGDPLDLPVHDALRTPPAIHRFYRLLLVLQRSAEGQLAAKGASHAARMAKLRMHGTTSQSEKYQEALAEHETWRAGALRFKTGVEERMAEISSLMRELDAETFADRLKEERNQALLRTLVLEDAIRRHRDHECTDDTCDQAHGTCAADDELWALL